MKTSLLIAFFSTTLCFGRQLDILTIEGGAAYVGEEIVLDVFFQDVSGTILDTTAPLGGFYAIGVAVNLDPSLVSAAVFEPAGVGDQSNSIFIPSADTATGAYSAVGIYPESLPLNEGAASPGDLMFRLRLTPSSAAAGRTIAFTINEVDTFASGFNGQPTLTPGNGLLGLDIGEVTVTLNLDLPNIVSFDANPAEITDGMNAQLRWQVENADSLSISPGIGSVAAPTGSVTVTPSTTTTYTLTAENEDGQVSAMTTIVVTVPPPVIDFFNASPQTLIEGETSSLSWSVENVTSVNITPGIGSVSASGQVSVSPQSDTTYTLTASGAGGEVSAETTITVFAKLEIVSFSLNPNQINLGESATLSWEVENAESISLSGVSGALEALGSVVVSPEITTTYTLTVQGAGGQATDAQVTLTVIGETALITDLTEIDFGASQQDAALVLSVNTSGSHLWAIGQKPDWLQVSPDSGSLDSSGPVQLNLTVDRSSLFPGRSLDDRLEIVSGTLESAFVGVQIQEGRTGAGSARLFFPLLIANEDKFTTISLTNLASGEAQMSFKVFGYDGILVNEPVVQQLPVLGSFAQTFTSLPDGRAWAVAELTRAEGQMEGLVSGIINIRGVDGETLVCLSPTTDGDALLFVPHIAKDASFFTQTGLIHTGNNQEQLGLDVDSVGTYDLGAFTPGQGTHFDYREVMGGEISGPGWARLGSASSRPPLHGVEIFGRASGSGQLQEVGVTLNGQTANELLFVHIAQDLSSFWTGVVVINMGSQTTNVRFEAFDNEGQLLESSFSESFDPSEKKTYLVTSAQLDFGEGAAWVRAVSDQPLAGYELFGTFLPDDRFAGFEAVTQLGTQLFIPHSEDGVTDGGFSGLAVINPDTAAQVEVTLKLVSFSGSVKETNSVQLGPGVKLVRLASSIFETGIEQGDVILIESPKPIAGFALYGEGRRTMGAVSAFIYSE